jgi:hypothetical protein
VNKTAIEYNVQAALSYRLMCARRRLQAYRAFFAFKTLVGEELRSHLVLCAWSHYLHILVKRRDMDYRPLIIPAACAAVRAAGLDGPGGDL